MNNLQVFNYDANQVRIVEKNGEPFFVLKDVCTVLELTNPTMVAKKLDDDERAKFNLGRQGCLIAIHKEVGEFESPTCE